MASIFFILPFPTPLTHSPDARDERPLLTPKVIDRRPRALLPPVNNQLPCQIPNRQPSFGDAAKFVQNARNSGNSEQECLFFEHAIETARRMIPKWNHPPLLPSFDARNEVLFSPGIVRHGAYLICGLADRMSSAFDGSIFAVFLRDNEIGADCYDDDQQQGYEHCRSSTPFLDDYAFLHISHYLSPLLEKHKRRTTVMFR
jgi:hypothetical protein